MLSLEKLDFRGLVTSMIMMDSLQVSWIEFRNLFEFGDI